MYRTLDCGWADDPKVRQLPPNGMLLFVYLIANRLSHVSGIYYLPDAMVQDALKITRPALDTLWHTLSVAGLAFRDKERAIVLVPQMFKRQGSGEKNQRAAANQLRNLHGSPLIHTFLKTYPDVTQFVPPEICHTLSIGYPAQVESGIPEQEQEKDQEKDQEKKGSAEGAPPPGPRRFDAEDDFGLFWAAYPNKVGRGAARKAWDKAAGKRPPIADVLAAVERYRESPKVKEGFTANPATWLNQERWTDEPPENPRSRQQQPPIKLLRGVIVDIYEERAKKGVMTREACAARISEVSSIQSSEELQRILNSLNQPSATEGVAAA